MHSLIIIKKDTIMFIIWGSVSKEKLEGSTHLECRICQRETLYIYSMRSWLTIFFVPVFPTSSKEYYFVCSSCENSYKVEEEMAIEYMVDEDDSLSDTEHDE